MAIQFSLIPLQFFVVEIIMAKKHEQCLHQKDFQIHFNFFLLLLLFFVNFLHF